MCKIWAGRNKTLVAISVRCGISSSAGGRKEKQPWTPKYQQSCIRKGGRPIWKKTAALREVCTCNVVRISDSEQGEKPEAVSGMWISKLKQNKRKTKTWTLFLDRDTYKR